MALTRNQVAQLYTPIYDDFMLAAYDEYKMVHTKLFDDIDDKTKTYLTDDLSTLGEWEEVDEGSGDGYEDPTLGYPKTFTQTKKLKKFQVSYEAHDQDEYALIKKEGQAQALGLGGHAKVENDTSGVIKNAFSTAGPDGEFLYDTDHPRNREQTDSDLDSDNLLTGAFSHDNLETAEKQITDNLVSPSGIPIPEPTRRCLVYAPNLRGPVARVLHERAEERPGTANRDINRFSGNYEPHEWIYLAAKYGGSDTAWHIIFPEFKYLKIIWNARPHFTAWADEENEYYKFKGRMLYISGASNWRFGFGSTGL